MSELPPEDPFSADDPRAAERERRRREREARRRERAEGNRRSLADRVSGILGSDEGGEAAAGGEDAPRERPPEQPPRPQPPEPEAPSSPRAEPEPEVPRGEREPEAPRPPRGERPARREPERSAEPPPERAGRDRPTEQQPTAPPPGHEPEPARPSAREPEPPSGPGRLPPRRSRFSRPVPGDPRSRAPGAPDPADDGSAAIRRRRRLAAAGAVFGIGVLVVLMLSALRGNDEPEPVAAPEPIETMSVTVPEGLTIDQMADVAKENNLKGNYEKAVKQARKDFPLQRYDAADAPSMEGFLFPATYELEKKGKGGSVADLVDKQLEAFRQNFDSVNLRRAERKNLTPYEVLIIASMVEKEVQIAEERPRVAAVIYNRLAAGDTLGIDATLRYELENYDEQLLESELAADTPYNTRVNGGLPPTPIGNPGLASIEAAAKPANTDDYYFVIEPGTCNEHFFTDEESEFLDAQARYQEALQAEGGSPTEC